MASPDGRRLAALLGVKLEQAKPISGWVKDFNGMDEVRSLGRGGFGSVTLVVDRSNEQRIGLKSLAPSGGDVTPTFMREVQFLVSLAHPCVIPIVGYYLPTPTAPAKIGTKFAVDGSLRDVLNRWQCLDDTELR